MRNKSIILLFLVLGLLLQPTLAFALMKAISEKFCDSDKDCVYVNDSCGGAWPVNVTFASSHTEQPFAVFAKALGCDHVRLREESGPLSCLNHQCTGTFRNGKPIT